MSDYDPPDVYAAEVVGDGPEKVRLCRLTASRLAT